MVAIREFSAPPEFLAQAGNASIPEPTRTILLMALLGILLVGLLLMVGTTLGAHWVRRWGRFRRGPVVPQDVITPRAPPRTADPQRLNPSRSQQEADTIVSGDKQAEDDTVISP